MKCLLICVCAFLPIGNSNGGGSGSSLGVCRFCGSTATSGLLASASVCEDPECQVGNKLTLHTFLTILWHRDT